MSDSWLQFIPTDPVWQPTQDAAKSATSLLESFVPTATEICAKFRNTTEFFHPGGNWSGVKCPSCGKDIESWWSTAMDHAAQNDFQNLMTITPCCDTATSLNSLSYAWPAGFGRFVLEAMNPNVKDLSDERVQALSHCLGHSLRKIWVHI